MSNVVFTWELGAGLGHLARLRPLACGLAAQGRRVYVATRDVPLAGLMFEGTPVRILAAPAKIGQPANYIKQPRSFAHILHNVGFAHEGERLGHCRAWQTLFDLVSPSLVVLDHSPTALLASQGLSARRVVFGDGFCCPPHVAPWPDLRPWLRPLAARLAADEQRVLATANGVLRSLGQAALRVLAELYRADATCLATFAELDPYPARSNGEYFGAWPPRLGEEAVWPAAGAGLASGTWRAASTGPASGTPRAFVYVRPFEAFGHLLQTLAERGWPTIVFAPGTPPPLREEMAGTSVRFVSDPVDVSAAMSQCTFAVANATHGTTAAALLAGKPILQIPNHLEQFLVARRTTVLGAGILAKATDPDAIAAALDRLASDGPHAQAARKFAARYHATDGPTAEARLLARLTDLAGPPGDASLAA